jgi:hypothetical protein
MGSITFLLVLFSLYLVHGSFILELTNVGSTQSNIISQFYTSQEYENGQKSEYNVTLAGNKLKLEKIPLTDNYTYMALHYPDGTQTEIEEIVNACMDYMYPGAPYPCN